MSIYDVDRDGLRKLFYKFHKTLYGRTIFFFAYFIPFALFITAAVSALFALFYNFNLPLINIATASIIAFVPTFIFGNIYFYNEIRKFANHRDRVAHHSAKKK